MIDLARIRRTAAPIARATIAHHSRSFALASRMLDRRVRDQTAVVYAWCRRADDAIDERGAASPDESADALATLARQLEALYHGPGPAAPGHGERPGPLLAADPVLVALRDVVRAREIPRAYPRALLAGLAMDAAGTRYRTLDELIGYAWRVAGVVGLMMTHVFGVADEGALVHAAHLGIAMQLTNIARDVAEDWARGRLYVPDELLAHHGQHDLRGALGGPLPARASAALAAATEQLLVLADAYYRSGDAGLRELSPRSALAVRAARLIYADIGRVVRAHGCDPRAARAVVGKPRKLWLVLRAAGYASWSWLASWREPRVRAPSETLSLRAALSEGAGT